MLSRAALLYDQAQEWVVVQWKAEAWDGSLNPRADCDGENIRGVITYG